MKQPDVSTQSIRKRLGAKTLNAQTGLFRVYLTKFLSSKRIFATARTIIVVIMISLLSVCSIFDLKSPEPPLVGGGTEDPLNIGDIIRIVRESAVDMDYKDYFTNEIVFEYTLLRHISGRDNVINMLNRLRAQTSLVEWQVEKANKRYEGQLQIVENVPYIVYSGGGQICTGFADFHIVRDTYMISKWKDMPDDGNAPFFEP